MIKAAKAKGYFRKCCHNWHFKPNFWMRQPEKDSNKLKVIK